MTEASRHALIEAHLPLVPLTRQRMQVPPHVHPDDLDGAGRLGLVKAGAKWDPERGIRFRSYAISFIKWEIREFLRAESWIGRSGRRDAKAGTYTPPTLESLEYAAYDDGSGAPLTVAEGLADSCRTEEQGTAGVRREAIRLAVRAHLLTLPPREREVLVRYFFRGETLVQIAGDHRLTADWIGQIKDRACRRLRGGLEAMIDGWLG